MVSPKFVQGIGMLTGQHSFADVRKGMSPQLHLKVGLAANTFGRLVPRILVNYTRNSVFLRCLKITVRVLQADGQAWQSPGGRADCWGIVHAAIPVFFAHRLYLCGAGHQRPAESAQTAADNGHAQPPASALLLPRSDRL